MMPSFLNAAFLAGLAGAAIPLLIHLLNRERVRRVDFGWQRFLAAAHQERMRHFKIRQLLLLLLRMLVCALLALAFARPFLRDVEADQALAAMPTYVAVVVDVSYSMGYGKWLQRARRQVLEIADSLASGDQMSLLAAGGEVRTLVGWTNQLQLVRAAAREKLKSTYAPTDLGTAFRVAEERLRLAPPGHKKLYIISDHQESGWGRLDRGDRTDQGIELALIDVGDPGRGNLAVVDVQPADGDGALLMARLRHFGAGAVGQVPVRLVVGESEVEARTVGLHAGGKVDVTFALPPGEGAVYSGWVELEGDRLAADNRRYFAFRSRHHYETLCVGGDEGATFYLRRALDPWEDRRGRRVRTEVVGADGLDAGDLAGRDVVFLCDVPSLSGSAAQALEQFVQRGGGLVAVAGENSDWSLGGLLPRRNARVHRVGAEEEFAVFTDVDYEHSLFEPFRAARHGNFGLARTSAYVVLEEGGDERVLMRFDDGRPALLEYSLGAGKVLVCATAFDGVWSDLPRRTFFPALVHEMVRYLAVEAEEMRTYAVGDRLPGREDPVAEPGIYTLPSAGGTRTVAVNVDGREADLHSIELSDLQQRLSPDSPEDSTVAVQPLERSDAELEDEQNMWWFVMIGVLGLALGEMLLANRT